MNPEQIDIILGQNAQLMEQNQQLIALLQQKVSVPAPAPKPKRSIKQEKAAVHVTRWFANLNKSLHPAMAAALSDKLKKANLWAR